MFAGQAQADCDLSLSEENRIQANLICDTVHVLYKPTLNKFDLSVKGKIENADASLSGLYTLYITDSDVTGGRLDARFKADLQVEVGLDAYLHHWQGGNDYGYNLHISDTFHLLHNALPVTFETDGIKQGLNVGIGNFTLKGTTGPNDIHYSITYLHPL